MLQELTRMTMHMRDQRFNSTHASAKAVPLERLHTSLGAGVVKGQGDQYWLRPQFQCDIDEEIWTDSQEEKTFLWNHFIHPFAYPKVVHTFNKVTNQLEEIVKYVPSITHGLMSDDQRGRARARQQLRVVVDVDEDDFD